MSELNKLRDAQTLKHSKPSGASELREIADQGSVVLDTNACRGSDVDKAS